jgi:crossover junction endodeoxyribonuclease RuvC
MIIIGIDPGTATTGFGVVDVSQVGKLTFLDAGVITTTPDMAMPHRLRILHEELGQLLAEHKPEAAAVEQLFFSTNVTTAMSVGQARGVILLALAEAGLIPSEFTPMQIKQAITGYGGAKKPQIQEMVKTLLKLPRIPKPDDAADALAMAITLAHTAWRNNPPTSAQP